MSSIIKRIPINFEARTIKPLNIVIVWHPKWSRPRRSSLIRNVYNGGIFLWGFIFLSALLGTFTISETDILLLTKHQHPTDDRPLSFLSDLSPIIGYACHSLTHWLTNWLTDSCLVNLMAMNDTNCFMNHDVATATESCDKLSKVPGEKLKKMEIPALMSDSSWLSPLLSRV